MASNRIQLKGEFRYEEALASGVVSPGMLLEVTSTGAVKAHATEGGHSERAVAVEDALQGNTTDDDYADGALVPYHLEQPGAEVQMLIAVGEDISVGDKLISDGLGSLIAEASATSAGVVEQIIAIAMEDIDLTDSDDVATLAAVRIV